MKYNKINKNLKSKMIGKKDISSTEKIISGNKNNVRKPVSLINSLSKNVGSIVNKESLADKNTDKLEKLLQGTEEKKEVTGKKIGIEAFKKGEVTYIKYKGKEVPVSYLLSIAQKDPEAMKLVKDINRKRKESNIAESFAGFLLSNYS